jgi:hypothetical protein
MEISKAEMANAANAAAAATQSPIELRGGEILVKALQAENVKYIWGYPGVPFCTSTTLSSNKTPFSTCWFATNKLQFMQPMAMHVPPAMSVLPWSLLALA